MLDQYDFKQGDFIIPTDAPAAAPETSTTQGDTQAPATFSAIPSDAQRITTVDRQSEVISKTFDPVIRDWTKHIAHRFADMGDMQALAAWLGNGAWDELPTGDMVKSVQQALIASDLAGRFEASHGSK
ncbi:hypothetical protein CCP4SC76_2180001 [Gammaproteobacteria bacterium]